MQEKKVGCKVENIGNEEKNFNRCIEKKNNNKNFPVSSYFSYKQDEEFWQRIFLKY